MAASNRATIKSVPPVREAEGVGEPDAGNGLNTMANPSAKPLVVRVGWAAQIRRTDGSTFLAAGSEGILPPVWNLGGKNYADRFVRRLRAQQFDAKRVRVEYAEPRVR